MKSKLQLVVEVHPIPNREPTVYMVQTQYVDGGSIHTNSNNDVGWSHEEAVKLAAKIKEETHAKHR